MRKKLGENMKYHYYEVIEKLKKRGSSPGLETVRGLLDVLGHPEERLRIVHIAGTNGKGSVFAFLASMLKEGGYRVGRYISPTIHSYEERFQIDGKEISPDKLEMYFSRMERAMAQMENAQTEKNHEMPGQQPGQPSVSGGQPLRLPTLFEVETALAFLYFAEEGVDFALIETGMGGTCDATNVIEHPMLTVISSISYDHKAFLGDTLPEIAGQKAGIIKEQVPVVVSENVPEVCRVLEEKAREKHAECTFIKEADYRVETEAVNGSTFIWKKHRFTISLPGRHQISNAVTALTAAEKLSGILSKAGQPQENSGIGWSAMQQGLAGTRWPGRLELLHEKPYIFRDGAHNPDGARKLGQFLEKHFTNQKIIYIMGVLKDKEYEKMLAELLPLAAQVYTFRPDNERGLSGEVLAGCARTFGVKAESCDNVNAAMERAVKQAKKEDVLVICGSLSFMEEMDDSLWQDLPAAENAENEQTASGADNEERTDNSGN
ncbi:hypothetical protein B5E53_00930 [Eubacterium sp. An11]|uniref:bifunctional folylpolyglutamate synthase/dihydrofolate synthase n=1 Tax=Eubacterium sp. An11 TaxID=1965542 RepID=UPI000B3A62D6|nr:folylpolyglutamate synthase/dihydrofolate synthase family protein [Eubacterium sp. An11]OUQ70215.1 hypothetical protein B5E53_00930 [Eubacterium sp. An11]